MKVVELIARLVVSAPVLLAWFVNGLSAYSVYRDLLEEEDDVHLNSDLTSIAICMVIGLPPLTVPQVKKGLLPGIDILCALAFWTGGWFLQDVTKTQEPQK